MEGSAWRLLRALLALGFVLLMIPVVITILVYGFALRRIVLDAIKSLLQF